MPPKAKFTRSQIIQAALAIIRENGMAALSARTLGAKLGSSARPIFTVFQSMEEVQQKPGIPQDPFMPNISGKDWSRN